MKKLLISFFPFYLMAGMTAFAQTKTITETDTARRVLIKCHVLKANRSIKEGPYAEYTPYNNDLLTEGFYKNNLKDSVWKQYKAGKLIEQGTYKAGKRVAIWSAYDRKGALTLKYDYTNSKLLEYKPDSRDTAKTFLVINGQDTTKQLLDTAPIYLDGRQMAIRTIITEVRYPKKARENNITGKVLIGFTIGADGKTSGYHVVQSVGAGCDEEALSVVKNIDGDWLPGMLNGKPVAVAYIIPISFNLQ